MTVKEMITELQKFDSETKVFVFAENDIYPTQEMTVKEMITELQKFDSETKVFVFAENDIYPTFDIVPSDIVDGIEIGCGWEPIRNGEEED